MVNFLDEQDCGESSKAKSTVHGAGGSSARLVASTALVGGLVALLARVGNLATAEESTTNKLLVLEGLVESAGSGYVVGRLEVEGTSDVVKLWGFDTGST